MLIPIHAAKLATSLNSTKTLGKYNTEHQKKLITSSERHSLKSKDQEVSDTH